jgi:2-polyprenyl-3-methyl-5-hydroxy-6-metoxy-1,4-benzoquinol methylase
LSKEIIKKYGKANLITANNVFAHIPDPKDMMLGMKNLLKPNGEITIEVQWFKDVIRKILLILFIVNIIMNGQLKL